MFIADGLLTFSLTLNNSPLILLRFKITFFKAINLFCIVIFLMKDCIQC